MKINTNDFKYMCEELYERIKDKNYKAVYGVPRGGTLVAQYLSLKYGFVLLQEPEEGCLVVDDLIDSGRTKEKFKDYDFEVLIDKRSRKDYDWIQFWYEKEDNDIKDSVTRILQSIGEDANREGLTSTPNRVERLYKNCFYGYTKKLEVMDETKRNSPLDKDVIPITIFNTDQHDMLIRNTEFISFCEHHIVPFAGKAYVGIIPDKKLLGMNKIDKIVKYFAARLQIQERMTTQIVDWIMENIKPLGVIVVIQADHFCAKLQGDNGDFTTSAVRGVFATEPKAREEFLRLMK